MLNAKEEKFTDDAKQAAIDTPDGIFGFRFGAYAYTISRSAKGAWRFAYQPILDEVVPEKEKEKPRSVMERLGIPRDVAKETQGKITHVRWSED